MDLEQRLVRLERGNRRMKRIGAFVLLTAAVVLLSGQAKGKDLQHLEVRSLTLKDKDGKTRAYLGTGADAPGLLLFDRDGKMRAGFSVAADGSPALALYYRDGMRARLSLLTDGSPALALWDKGGHMRAVLNVDAEGSPRVRLFDTKVPKGEVIWQAPP